MAGGVQVSNTAGLTRNQALRQRVDEFTGMFFYGTMLKEVREHHLTKSKLGFGGRGEEAFGSQLDQELALRMGKASHSKLTDAIFKQLGGKPERGLSAASRSGKHAAATLSPKLLADLYGPGGAPLNTLDVRH